MVRDGRLTRTCGRGGLCVVVLASMLASCRPYQPQRHVSPPLTMPAKFAEAAEAEPVQPGPDRWWEAFGDKRLAALVERALSDNFSIRRAWARLAAARAVAEIEGSRLRPQVDLDAGLSKERTTRNERVTRTVPPPVGPMGIPLGMPTMVSERETRNVRTKRRWVTPAASYEVDVWGRLRSLEEAAELDVAATRADLDAVAMTLAASVADTYFGIVEQRAQRALILEQLKVNETFLDLTKLRFGQGQASALDVYQQRQQVASRRSSLPLVESRLKVLEHQLAVLLGQPPGAQTGGPLADLPATPPAPATGVPAELLKRRPDVRAAALSVAAADHRVAAAIADRFPSVRLTGQLPFRWTHVADTIRERGWSVGASLTAPLFDGGRRAAEVRRSKAVVAERVNDYAAAVLTALREVEDALVQERQRREFLRRVEEQLSIARLTLREARARYVRGLSDYLPVLTALRDVQRLELVELSEKRQLLGFRIRLYRALGGSWMGDLAPSRTDASTERRE